MSVRQSSNVGGMTSPTLLTMRAIADRIGVGYRTVRNYHQTAERRRREDRSRPGDFPPPDQMFDRTPVWKAATIVQWQRHRPGRGAGGGRPRKDAKGEVWSGPGHSELESGVQP